MTRLLAEANAREMTTIIKQANAREMTRMLEQANAREANVREMMKMETTIPWSKLQQGDPY